MSEKIREEFEGWCAGKLNIDGCDEFYFNANTNLAWVAWQASRAALVVELPCSWYQDQDGNILNREDDVKSALEDAGVSYK